MNLLKSYKIYFGYFILYGLLYLFISLPFAVEKFNIYWMIFNRIVFFVISFVSIYWYLEQNNFILKCNVFICYIIFFSIYSYFIGLYYFDSNYLILIIKIYELIGTIAIIWFIKHINLVKGIIREKQKIFKIIYFVVLFYAVDVVIQSIFKIDIFGFVNHFQDRYWGVFQYGAPSFGVFIVSFIFLPFVIDKGIKKYIIFIIFFIAMLLSNDRAPLLIMVFGLLIYLFIKNKIYFFLFIGITVGFLFIIINYLEYLLPYRIQMLFKLFSTLWDNDFILDISEQQEMSVSAYLDIWMSNIEFWFSLDNFINFLFGSGFGNLREILKEATEYSRIHNMLLEIFMTFGLIGTIILIFTFKKLFKYTNKSLLLILPYFTPFLFFSLYSLNQIILFLISFMMYILYNERRRIT